MCRFDFAMLDWLSPAPRLIFAKRFEGQRRHEAS